MTTRNDDHHRTSPSLLTTVIGHSFKSLPQLGLSWQEIIIPREKGLHYIDGLATRSVLPRSVLPLVLRKYLLWTEGYEVGKLFKQHVGKRLSPFRSDHHGAATVQPLTQVKIQHRRWGHGSFLSWYVFLGAGCPRVLPSSFWKTTPFCVNIRYIETWERTQPLDGPKLNRFWASAGTTRETSRASKTVRGQR
jgi:hypothetical protein